MGKRDPQRGLADAALFWMLEECDIHASHNIMNEIRSQY